MAKKKTGPIEIEGKLYFNLEHAAKYLGVSLVTLGNVLKRDNIIPLEQGFGHDKYLSKEMLDDLLRLRPVSEKNT